MLAVALLVLSAVSTGVGPVPAGGRLPLPPPRAALQFEAGMKEIRLDELVLRLAQLTGQELAMTQLLLQQMNERLESTEPVPPEEVHAFVEGLLARQGVVLAPVTGGSRPILGVHSPENSPTDGTRGASAQPSRPRARAAIAARKRDETRPPRAARGRF